MGVINFINAVLTGILVRKHKLAMFQSVGVTEKQLNAALGSLGGFLRSIFCFFTYQFTVLPVLTVIPLFLILGIPVPLLMYRSVNRRTLEERLRETASWHAQFC